MLSFSHLPELLNSPPRLQWMVSKNIRVNQVGRGHICSTLPAQAGLSQSTWHSIASRWLWNISSGGDPWPLRATCSSAWALYSKVLPYIQIEFPCAPLSALCLMSYCLVWPRRAWLHPPGTSKYILKKYEAHAALFDFPFSCWNEIPIFSVCM